MTTESVPAGGDPRRLLSDVRALSRRVRLDQRVTWFALLVLAAVTLVAIPIDWLSIRAECADVIAAGGEACGVRRLAAHIYWPVALLVAYVGIALFAVRAARARGLGARVRPYVVTGVALTVVSVAAWLAVLAYLDGHPPFTLPGWAVVLDRLVQPAGTIGVALLVLAWLERHLALALFATGYLVVVLVPVDFGWHPGPEFLMAWLAPQIINAVVLLLGAAGFAYRQRVKR